MPITSRYNIDGQLIFADPRERAAYIERWRRWAHAYARGVGVGLSRLAGKTALAGATLALGADYVRDVMARRRAAIRRRQGRRIRTAGASTSTGGVSKITGMKRKRQAKITKYLKSRRGASRLTRTKYQTKGGQLVFEKRVFGRRRPVPSMGQLRKMTLWDAVWRFQGINKLNTLTADTNGVFPGYFPLLYVNSATDGSDSYIPIHIYDLTQLPSTDLGYNQAVGHELRLTNNLGAARDDTFYWAVGKAGQDRKYAGGTTVGGTTIYWQQENFETAGNSDANKSLFRQDWVDIRLNLYGAKAQPTMYEISIVSFKDERCDVRSNLSPTGWTEDSQSMFRALARPMVTNPIVPGSEPGWKFVHVHKKYTYVIQPSENSDQDTNPESRVVKLFFRDGRVLDYKSRPKEGLINEEDVHDAGFWYAAGSNELRQENPYFLARLYLMIRALNTTSAAAASSNRTNTPSYDLCLRKKVTYSL